LRANCLPSAQDGYAVPFMLMMLENFNSGNQHASYSNGLLTFSSRVVVFPIGITTLSSTGNQELFSYEVYCQGLANSCQPFWVGQAYNQLGVSISQQHSITGQVFPIQVTFNGIQSFVGSCDATTGSLTGTLNGNTNVVITLGTPYNPATQNQ
jgi:hypothetical protein